MTIKTALQLRLERAHRLVSAGAVHECRPGHFEVHSQTHPRQVYDVQVAVDGHTVLGTHCNCQDWQKMQLALDDWPVNPGISQVDYSPACKHVLSALIRLGVIE